MSSEPKVSYVPRSKLFWAFVAFPLACVLVLAAVWYAGKRAVDSDLAALRGKGLPTAGHEVNEFYAVEEGATDTTGLWVNAILAVKSANAGQKTGDLPIVGTGEGPVPVPGEEWSRLDDARKLLEGMEAEFQLLRKATAAGGQARFPVDFSAGINTLLPLTQDARGAARVLALDAYVSAHDGQGARTLEDLRGLFALSDAMQREPCLISQLVRVAIHAVGCDATARLLPHGEWSDADLEALQKSIDAARFQEGIERALCGERGISLSALEDIPLGPFRQSNVREALRYFDRSLDGYTGSWPETLQRQRELAAELNSMKANSFNRMRLAGVLMLLPAMEQGANAGARAEARQKCTVGAIAAQRYRLKHGRLPESLAELGEMLPAAAGKKAAELVDPFDGKPMRFKTDEKRIVIYSMGENGTDDEGDIEQKGQERPKDVGVSIAK